MTVKTKFNEDLLEGLKRKETKKVVLLYSGGVDSTAAGVTLKEEGYEICPLYIDYGQSARVAELFLCKKGAKKAGFKPLKVIKTNLMKDLSKSKLLGKAAKDDNDAWVPGRNTLFMIIAGIYAQQLDADGITIGYMLDDNFVFGDNDYFHHKAIEESLSKSFLRPLKVFMPIVNKTKKELIDLLDKYQLTKMTVSCWNAKVIEGKVEVCHQCANCLERDKL